MPYPRIIKTDRTTPAALRAIDAEGELFKSLGLRYRDHDVDLNGLRIRVLEVGEGSPLLMLPGWIGDAWTFASLVPHLSGRRVLLVNLPGAGLSDGIDYKSINLRQFAFEAAAAVLDHFEVERAEIAANGIGGAWALWFAAELPQRVSVVTQLGCPAFIAGMRVPFRQRLLSIPLINRLLLRWAGGGGNVAGEWTETQAACAYAFSQLPERHGSQLSLLESTLSMTGTRHRIGPEELRRVRAPVQFIWGESDPFGGTEVAGNVVVMVPSAILHEIPGGHMPWLDAPELCGAWIRSFHDDVLADPQPEHGP